MTQKMIEKSHILFLFSDTGGGHRSAAKAIIEALNRHYPDQVTTEMLDFFAAYAPPPLDMAASTYGEMAKVPDIWELGYRLSDGKHRSKIVQEVVWPYIRRSTKKLVEEHPCDLFVSVHPLVNTPMLRALGDSRVPYITVVTDMVSTHAFWYNNRADLTLVPTEEAKNRGVAIGMNPDRIHVVGQPVADQFCRPPMPRHALRDMLGWPGETMVVLIVGGGEGMGPIEETVRAVDQAGLDVMMVVIAGRNQTLKQNLESADLQTPTRIYGFVDNMPDLMNASDMIITKAGPGTISEAFIAGLPIILYARMPGQEEGNVDYVVEKGAGVWAPYPEQVVAVLRRWTQNPVDREAVAHVSKSLARPEASKNIAAAIMGMLNSS